LTGAGVALSEDAYGRAKRLAFVASVIAESNPKTVLDFGCGTGTQLTLPLARAHPGVSFLGIDSDRTTIDWARRQPALANLAYAIQEVGPPERRFDMIIASEVLEHVEAPDALLRDFRALLAEGGRLVVTVPNGYGPFEAAALVEQLLTLGGVLPVLRRIKHAILGKPRIDASEALTLAVSPHINFFSSRMMRTLLREAGFEVIRFRSRTVFCGFIIDWMIRGPLIGWNAALADRLPAGCASDWMFVSVKSQATPAAVSSWRRNRFDRFRRHLSERRWAGVSLPYG
jgi:SAM-dependent methyltransferase